MDQFPHSIIVKIEDELNFYSIKAVKKKLIYDTASILIELERVIIAF